MIDGDATAPSSVNTIDYKSKCINISRAKVEYCVECSKAHNQQTENKKKSTKKGRK